MSRAHILDLPNEVLLNVLNPFTTHNLLQVALVSTRFHDVVLRILHHRLALAALLKEHKIIFEIFHPVDKNTEPYLFCDYLGTPGLSSIDDSRNDPIYFEHDGRTGFGRLSNFYSHFRPVPPGEKAPLRRSHPAGQSPNFEPLSATTNQPYGAARILSHGRSEDSPSEGVESEEAAPLATYNINLDPDEGFTQLSMVTNLVKPGPRRGLFENIVNVIDVTVRLKRNWMRQVAENTLDLESSVQKQDNEELRTLWVDDGQNVGLKVRITERKFPQRVAPVLFRDTEPAVSYKMEYDVLLVRTTRLLLAVEEALLQDRNDGRGKALIFGSFTLQIPQEV